MKKSKEIIVKFTRVDERHGTLGLKEVLIKISRNKSPSPHVNRTVDQQNQEDLRSNYEERLWKQIYDNLNIKPFNCKNRDQKMVKYYFQNIEENYASP